LDTLLVGGNYLTVKASFWDVQTSGQTQSAGGTPKTTAEMKTMSTFTDAGWDFVEIWGIVEGQTYPFLRTEPAGDAKYSGGTGTVENPYRIATAEDLNDIGNYEEDWDKHFILVNDVNLAQYTGTQFKIIGKYIDWYDPGNKPFTGVFDGNNHKIWNFTWTSGDRNGIGLFGYVGDGGQIKNLGMENVNVNAGVEHVGGLVGTNSGKIMNCYSRGTILGNIEVGGLVGVNWLTGTIAECYFGGSVSAGRRVGGLVGDNWNATIDKCFSFSTFAGVTGADCVGGLVGVTQGGSIINCYSTSTVSGTEKVGGLLGIAVGHGATISECYSTGSVDAEEIFGGLVGNVWVDNTVNSSFWDIETSGQLTSAGGTPKTTAEMKTKSTFTDAGWDFVEIWGIVESQTYPYLKIGPDGDLNDDKKVNLEDLAILASHWLEERK
jgi:hypothetical protein